MTRRLGVLALLFYCVVRCAAGSLTFNVNTTADTVDANPGDGICADSQGNCSVRAAMMESNASLSGQITNSVTIMIPAGTYTLTIPFDPNQPEGNTGHLLIQDGPLSVVGASAATTIIEAGTGVNGSGIPNGIDKVFSINPLLANGFDTSFSNLTIQYGLNTSTIDPFGGAFDWDAGSDGAGTLNITSCIITNNATVIADSTVTTLADGGGVSLTNEAPASQITQEGQITISNTTIANNIAQDAGGGIYEGAYPLQLSNSQILNNQAVDNPASQGIGQSGGEEVGGGVSVFGPTVGNQTTIQQSTFSGNTAGAQGGGIWTTAGIQVTSDILITNHASATGGGLFSNPINETTQVAGTNITQNTAGIEGGGVEVDNSTSGNNLSMTFSRIAGNTANSGNGLNNSAGVVTATDNWWGCNGAPASSTCNQVNFAANPSCDQVTGISTSAFTPWLTLSLSASPGSAVVGTSSTLTASLMQDCAGNAFTAGNVNLSALIGLPIAFGDAEDGTLSNSETTIQSNGTATSTFTAGTAAGTASAEATVDNATVTADITVQDFSISITPASQNVLLGNSVSYTLTVTPLDGFTGTVNITCGLSPSGPTLSGCPNSLTITSGPASANLTASTTTSNAAQNYTISATGSLGGLQHSASATLVAQDFQLSLAPTSQNAVLGSSANYTLTVTPLNGFTGTVSNIACSISPSGPTVTSCPSSVTITATSGAVTSPTPLTIATTTSNTAQNYTVSATGSVGSLHHSASATLVADNFTLSFSPISQAAVLGSSVNYTLTATPSNGFTGTVSNITCTISPSGPTVSGCPTSLTITSTSGPVSATVKVSLATSNVAENYTLTATGSNSNQPRSGSATLQAEDFAISLSPASQPVVLGGAVSYSGSVSAINNFTGTVDLSCPSPSGITVSGCPSSVTISSGPVGFTLTATTTTSIPIQAYTVSAIGTSSASPTDSHTASAQLVIPVINTVAGNGIPGYSGDGGPATSAGIYVRAGVAVDSAGNIYFSNSYESANNYIRKITASTGIITTVAGIGTAGYSGDGGPATSAKLYSPNALAVDSAGNIYIGDSSNHRIRKVSASTGIITTVAGNGIPGYSGDGGPATSAGIYATGGIAVDSAGNIYLAESFESANNRIRKITASTGIITTVAGTGTAGYSGDGGPATSAKLYNPIWVAVDSAGNIYIGDSSNDRVREVTASTGIITTVAGNGIPGDSGDGGPATSAGIEAQAGVAVDSAGNIYFANPYESAYNSIRKVTASTGIITTVAGTGTAGYSGDGGAATNAELYNPTGLAVDSAGNIYIGDSSNNRIRVVGVSAFGFK